MMTIIYEAIVFAAALSFVCLAAAPAAAQPVLTREGDA